MKSLPQLFAPVQRLAGPYVLRYIESQPDDHLDLQITVTNGQVLLSDIAKVRLRGCTYTLNGWTNPEDASKLVDEPIQPYTLYHLAKASIDAPMREWWRTMPEIRRNKPVAARRSELFFVVVPDKETWNGVGESANPIGRPLAFSQLPPFKLTNRVYGFETTFADETATRLDELDLTFNRRSGQRHTLLYSGVLEKFIRAKGYHQEPRRGLHDFSEQDCLEFADGLPLDYILAFDIEPPTGWHWIINYSHPNFVPNMSRVVERLNRRGAMAYNWMGQARFSLGQDELQGAKQWGQGNGKMDVYLQAYAHPERIKQWATPNAVINVGFGYDGYDFNFLPSDIGRQNSSPQALYLKELDACELASRVFPQKPLLAFAWGYMEFDIGEFPRNHVVEIPKLGAVARRTDNKPIYAPSTWQDSLTLSLLYCRYLFYWGPGETRWDPARVARYARRNLQPGEMEVWQFTQGAVPQVTGGAYPGKESMLFNATIGAASRYAQIQGICDQGERQAVATTYRRADRDGMPGPEISYPAYPDGSQFVQAARHRQPFTLVVKNPKTGHKVVFFQDVWGRPGRGTEFRFTFEGKTYTKVEGASASTTPLCTDGNRLFIGLLD